MLSLHGPSPTAKKWQLLPRDSQQSECGGTADGVSSPRESVQTRTARLAPSSPRYPIGGVSHREGLETALVSLIKKHRQIPLKMQMNLIHTQEAIDDLNAKLKTRDEQLAKFKAAMMTNIVEEMERFTAGLNPKQSKAILEDDGYPLEDDGKPICSCSRRCLASLHRGTDVNWSPPIDEMGMLESEEPELPYNVAVGASCVAAAVSGPNAAQRRNVRASLRLGRDCCAVEWRHGGETDNPTGPHQWGPL